MDGVMDGWFVIVWLLLFQGDGGQRGMMGEPGPPGEKVNGHIIGVSRPIFSFPCSL